MNDYSKNNYYDVVVLDSGVLCTHKNIDENSITVLNITKDSNDLYTIDERGFDTVGHGTAVISILQNNIDESVNICSIKILTQEEAETSCEIDKLLYALTYIKNNIPCTLIHMSCGVKYYNQDLKKICDELVDSGKIIVAAYSNDGSVSFPAAFPNVIGVDASLRCISSSDFVFVENSIVNLKAKGGNQRLAWVNPSYIINQGSSFAAPYVSAYIINMMKKGLDFLHVMSALKKDARYIYSFPAIPNKKSLTIRNRAAIFPYNKEMHNIVNYSDLLTFDIAGIYDIKQSGRVSKSIKNFDGNDCGTIQNIDSLDYKNINYFIIGHVNELEIYTKKNIKQDLLEKCLNYNINVYSFDDYLISDFLDAFKEKNLSIRYPYDTAIECASFFGKLYKIQSPVVAIMGTSMQQGKFSLQLMIKKLLKSQGYKVAHLATEPSGELFGAEYVYPFGYAGTAHETGKESKCILNYMMHKIDINNPDIIITGSQSGTVPMIFENAANLYTTSIDFLLGVQPDAVILCVNIFDDVSYIERTIKAIEGIADTRVIALALYPMKYPNNWFYYRNKREKCEMEELKQFINNIQVRLKKDIYIMDKLGYINLCNSIIDFFSER